MCFSTTASFTAGAVLCLTGVFALKQVKGPSQIAFAAMPLLFGFQQFSEGLVWLSLTNSHYVLWGPLATGTFLFFAQVLWPVWVPLSIWMIEEDAKRKKLLLILIAMGSVVSVYLAGCLLLYPVRSEIVDSHIHYILDFPLTLVWICSLFYFLPTVTSPMVSSNTKVPLLGFTILISYTFTKLFFANFLISVWCFFAAVISALILYIVVEINKPVPKSGKAAQPYTGIV